MLALELLEMSTSLNCKKGVGVGRADKLGLVRYQTFATQDFDAFNAEYTPGVGSGSWCEV